MPLRDVSALDEWRERESPAPAVSKKAEAWVLGLDLAPWLYPSTPFPELSFQPDFETRSAIIPETGGIEIFYRNEYVSNAVDLIWVGRT